LTSLDSLNLIISSNTIMVDEQKAENVDVEPNNVTESPPVEPIAPEVKEETVQPEKTEQSTEEPITEGEPKKVSGATKRIQGLVADKKKLEADNKSLAEQLRELTSGYQPQVESTPQSQIQPDKEVSVEDYRTDVVKTADALVQIRMNQQKIVDNINKEATEAIKFYPELDPDNKETFDRELSNTVAEATLAYVRSNPTASVKKFVDKLMKPYKKSLEQRVGDDTEKVAKQVTEAALRPTNVKVKEKAFDELTLKEMEDKLGVVH